MPSWPSSKSSLPRFRPSERFIRQVNSADQSVKQRIFPALRKLCENPHGKGVHLEPIKGQPGFYSARVTSGMRLLLMEREDTQGSYLEIVRFGSHDETY